MKYIKSWFRSPLICLTALLCCLPVAHSGDSNTLVVGLNPEYRPLVYKEGRKLTGIEPATAKELGKLLKKKIEFKEYPWAELIPALENGDIDVIMSGMSVTAERSKRINFTQPYLEIGQMAIIRKADIGRLSQPRAMYKAGMRVGVELGTTGEQYVKEYAGEAEIKPYHNPAQAFAALDANEIDFFVHDAPTSWNLAQDSAWPDLMALYSPLTKESIAWAVNKNNGALLATLNEALTTLRAAGTLNQIQYHWIPVKIEIER
ncbi:MAG: substrate-binding periplasmic protein [Candidatus Reddybacter sp.]